MLSAAPAAVIVCVTRRSPYCGCLKTKTRVPSSTGRFAIGGQRTALETPFHGAWAGAAEGDVVLVQFFDYSCGYCRQSNADVDRLLREDSRLKVIWREYPVLGPASDAAARVSIAAARQGRFRELHAQMFCLGRTTEAL